MLELLLLVSFCLGVGGGLLGGEVQKFDSPNAPEHLGQERLAWQLPQHFQRWEVAQNRSRSMSGPHEIWCSFL